MFKKKLGLLLALSLFVGGCWSEKTVSDKRLLISKILKQDNTVKPVIVIGGGLAGLTAANYLQQAGVATLVLEGSKPGGALAQSDSVRNWPGVFNAPGIEITNALKDQVLKNGATILAYSVTNIDLKQWPFVLTVQDETGKAKTIKTFSAIAALGAEPNMLGVPGESGTHGYWGHGVTNCAVCDGALFKDKTVAVVGGGDSAILEAAYLAGIAKKVYVLVRSGHLRAHDIKRVNLVKNLANVVFMFNTQVLAVRGDNGVVTHLELMNSNSKVETNLNVDGLFLAIGSTPNTRFFKEQCELDANGYIVLKQGQKTSVPGLFAAGDICDPLLKQAVTASAMGAAAALQAKEFLDEVGFFVEVPVSHADLVVEKKGIVSHVPKKSLLDEWVPDLESLQQTQEFFKKAENKLVVVDVYGSFCMPCQKMAPIVESLAQHYDFDVVFAKFNVARKSVEGPHFKIDDFAQLVGTHQVLQVPTFLLIKQGKVIHRFSGIIDYEAFVKVIEKYR